MEIKNRLFLYPVLCAENDDYEGCSFEVKSAINEELTDLVINFDVVLDGNEELQWLIRDGNAQVIVHIECSYTAYRTVVKINAVIDCWYNLAYASSHIHLFYFNLYLAPLPRNTAKTVFNKILKSRPMDQFSIYSTSKRTISSKSVISLLPLTCHIPVSPGRKLRRFL